MRYRPNSLILLPLSVAIVFACSNSALFGQSIPKSSAAFSELRDWKDASGNHTIRAEFLGVIDRARVALKTEDGKEMTIELSQLSNVDIYQAVKSDLMTRLAVAAPAAKSSPRNNLQPPSKKSKRSPRKAQVRQALPVSKPKPKVDEDLVTRVEEFIATIENEDTETIFETILHPKEFTEFSRSPNYKAGLAKFEKKKKARLLTALQSIDYKSIERKPGGKYQFQTGSAPISFKKLKGSWYLNN
jgi:hypothetical protein